MLEDWLKSYRFNELFDRINGFGDFVHNIVPKPEQRMGMSPHAHGGEPVYKPLVLPTIEQFAEDASIPGTIGSSSMIRAGLYIKEVFKLNKDNNNFRFMSPDETYSNKLNAIFEEVSRCWVWPLERWDKDLSKNGRAMDGVVGAC